jgi:hypothetical protein
VLHFSGSLAFSDKVRKWEIVCIAPWVRVGDPGLDELAIACVGTDAPPLGLIHTAYGGSMIEQWLPAETVDSCKLSCSNVTTCGVGEWWNQRILPYVNEAIER